MAEFGTPLGVDELLRLSGMAQGYTNERMGRANALRGLTGLRSVSGPSTGIDASLRSLSTATHKDISARLTDKMLGQRLDNEDQFRGRWDLLFGEDYNEFYNEVIEKWRAQVRLGISQASEERAIAGEKTRLDLAPGVKTKQTQAIAKEQARIKAEDIDEAMIAVIKRASEDDIKAINRGEDYYKVVRDRLINESAGWEPNHQTYYQALMEMADQKPKAAEITRLAKLALDDATQYVIDTTISGVEGGMSASGAYSNAVSAVRSGDVSGKYDDQEAVRRLKALGHNVVPLTKKEQVALDSAQLALTKEREKLVEDKATQYVVDATIRGVKSGMSVEASYDNAVQASRSGAVAGKFNDIDAVRKLKALGYDVIPPTTEWVFDLDKQKAVKVSERTLRQNPTKYGPPLSAVSGKLSENYFNAGMEMLVADQADDNVENPMTFEILYFYQLNGLSKFRKEDVGVMGRWSAKAQALRAASAPSTMSQAEALRLELQRQGLTGTTKEEDDLQE